MCSYPNVLSLMFFRISAFFRVSASAAISALWAARSVSLFSRKERGSAGFDKQPAQNRCEKDSFRTDRKRRSDRCEASYPMKRREYRKFLWFFKKEPREKLAFVQHSKYFLPQNAKSVLEKIAAAFPHSPQRYPQFRAQNRAF